MCVLATLWACQGTEQQASTRVAEGRAALERGDASAAEQAFGLARDLDDATPGATEGLAEAQLQGGRLDAALETVSGCTRSACVDVRQRAGRQLVKQIAESGEVDPARVVRAHLAAEGGDPLCAYFNALGHYQAHPDPKLLATLQSEIEALRPPENDDLRDTLTGQRMFRTMGRAAGRAESCDEAKRVHAEAASRYRSTTTAMGNGAASIERFEDQRESAFAHAALTERLDRIVNPPEPPIVTGPGQ